METERTETKEREKERRGNDGLLKQSCSGIGTRRGCYPAFPHAQPPTAHTHTHTHTQHTTHNTQHTTHNCQYYNQFEDQSVLRQTG